MKVFITGGSGFIGPEVIKTLVARGHVVNALCRSDASEAKVKSLGAKPVRGQLSDLELLKEQAIAADGVLHLAFELINLNPQLFKQSAEAEGAAIRTMCDAIVGSNKPFVATSGILAYKVPIGSDPVDESFVPVGLAPPFSFRHANADLTISYAKKGVNATIVALSPTTHGEGDHGFIPMWIKASKAAGFIPCFHNGENSWPTVNKSDAGLLYVLALEKGIPGSVYFAAGEVLKLKNIAKAISKKTGLEIKYISVEDSPKELGFMAFPLSMNVNINNEKTKSELDWTPTGAGLLENIANYY